MNAFIHKARHRRLSDRNSHGEFKCPRCRRREALLNEEPTNCPACGRPSKYSLDLDRFVHSDGSSNRACWISMTSGIELEGNHPTMNDDAYPLVYVAAELGCGTKEIEKRVNGELIRDDAGMRFVPATLVKQLIDERDAQQAAEAERRRIAAEHHARLREERRQQRRKLSDPHADALARCGAGWVE